MDVEEVGDELGVAGMGERRPDDTRGTVVEPGHGVEEVGDATGV